MAILIAIDVDDNNNLHTERVNRMVERGDDVIH